MKKAFLLGFLLSATLISGAFIEFFQAKSENSAVKLEWKTNTESSLKEFVVERKTVNGNFIVIGKVAARGDNSYYTFIDEAAFKSNDYVFVYRLKLVDTDSQHSYSKEISVSHSLSDVKRTWGSIKAMFR
ncbi:MAG: hypothetical protein HRU80_09080 [Ignavibacteriales bacterium]|nr:hypothetical protein [Ignavibacteriaceae bacterium]MCK6615519.1 hypothetical protein [Ignavibacteriaceae bacterium]QOJ29025.1 MAG: hypothetical protein HRU80_09080 [Ignavibacteriales bacterium]